jgi:glycosyltransferase involved in cell wall biosynthesis
VTGLLYEPADVDGLAAAMQRMQDPSLRDKLRAAARQEVGRYSPPVVAAELQQLYRRVAAQPRRGR